MAKLTDFQKKLAKAAGTAQLLFDDLNAAYAESGLVAELILSVQLENAAILRDAIKRLAYATTKEQS